MMNSRNVSLKTAMVSGIIAAVLFMFKDRDGGRKEFSVYQGDVPYRYLELGADNMEEITRDRWKVFVVRSMGQVYIDRVNEDIKSTNVAVLEVDSFSKAKLATVFKIKELPEEVLINDGVFQKNKSIWVDLNMVDFWRAIEIQLLLLYVKAYINFNRFLKETLDDCLLLISRAYHTVPFLHGFIIYF